LSIFVSPGCTDDLRGEIDLRALRDHRNVTPFEPEWEGFVTREISDTTPLPAKIYANEGLCQILFFQSDELCETSHTDRKGKYQKQQGIVFPKL
jgi:dCTP deaminase